MTQIFHFPKELEGVSVRSKCPKPSQTVPQVSQREWLVVSGWWLVIRAVEGLPPRAAPPRPSRRNLVQFTAIWCKGRFCWAKASVVRRVRFCLSGSGIEDDSPIPIPTPWQPYQRTKPMFAGVLFTFYPYQGRKHWLISRFGDANYSFCSAN